MINTYITTMTGTVTHYTPIPILIGFIMVSLVVFYVWLYQQHKNPPAAVVVTPQEFLAAISSHSINKEFIDRSVR